MAKAKVLVFDIETSPNLGYIWGKWQQDVIRFEREWYVLCFGYKWLGERKTNVVALPDFRGYKKDPENDYHVVKALWELFDEADIVIAHNGDAFDIKKMNMRFLTHGLPPPSPYKSIDTYKVARKYFKHNSLKLDDLGKLLGVGQKADTGGFDTWLGCMRGDPAAWARMTKYNKQDVVLLEKVYYALRPWMDNHPGINLIEGVLNGCPKCGSTKLQRRGTLKTTKSLVYQRYQCQNCFGWSQARVAERAPTKVEFVN